MLEYVGTSDLYNEYDLAELACHIEIDLCGWKIGKQDQYASAFGGMNYIRYLNSGKVQVHRMNPKFIEDNMTLVPTHIDRHASKILDKIDFNDTQKTYVIRELSHMADMIHNQDLTVKEYGDHLNIAWMLKKQMDDGITNSKIDAMLNRCIAAGAYGAKLLGAGGGGYMLTLNKGYSIHEAFKNRICLDVGVSYEGAKVVYTD
jgi:D-glycero-alpha-D-manno-heptose-7-phosphate kinase